MVTLKIEQLILFQDVVNLRSKSAVAKKYNLSIQNVSYALESLAKELKTTLFAEGVAKYQLTETGAAVYEFACCQLKAYHRLLSLPAMIAPQLIRIDIVRRLEEIIMPDLTMELLKQNIDNQITIFRPDTLEEMIERLREEKSDLAVFWDVHGKILVTSSPQEHIVKKVLFVAQPYIWVPKHSSLAKQTLLKKKDLTEQRFVIASDGNEQLTSRFIDFLSTDQIFFRTEHKELMAKFVDNALAVCIDFMLPSGKLIMQEVFAAYDVQAIAFAEGSVLECIMMYRQGAAIGEMLPWLGECETRQ